MPQPGHDPLPLGEIALAIGVNTNTSSQSIKSYTISTRIIQRKPNYSQHCYQSGVSILTNVFEVYILQVKVNRQNYVVRYYSTVEREVQLKCVSLYITHDFS